ncbi:MAG: hypothetical protein ACK5ME_04120 [Parahaliea sp.]
MSEPKLHNCLFLPCSATEIWALPTNCLAEIVTLYEVSDPPPEWIKWRGQQVPVLDLDSEQNTCWSDKRNSGLIAILLGMEGLGCEYLGVALRGKGLGLHQVVVEEVVDCPEEVQPHSVSAFRWRDTLYQVPDLAAVLKEVGEQWRYEEDDESDAGSLIPEGAV